jgi:hypothetical protein
LQQFLRVFKNIAESVSLRAQHFRSQLRRNFYSRHRAVFRNESNFIDANARVAGHRALQLFGEGTWLGISAGKRADKSRELRLGKVWCEVNAGDTGGSKQLRETFLRRRCSQRHSIQQYLIPRSAQQHSRIAAFLQRIVQLFPRRFELRHRSHVPEFVQACEFQQNVQAANKRASGLSGISSHFCGLPSVKPYPNTRLPLHRKQAFRRFMSPSD